MINELQKRKLVKINQDYPQILINSIPAKELFNEENLEEYIAGLKELDLFNPDFIVMVCNTIHIFYEKLQKEIGTEIISLKDEVREYLHTNNVKSLLILGTPLTINSGLYEFPEIKIIKPNEKEIRLLEKAIFNFNIGNNKQKQIQTARNICRKYNSERILLGCTELALMLQEDEKTINTIDILVNAVLTRFLNINKLNRI